MSTQKATQARTQNRLMEKFAETGLLREVVGVDLTMPNGKVVPNKKALQYKDDQSYISVVGSSYAVIQNEDVMQKLSQALVESDLNLKGFTVSHSSSATKARNLVKITLPEHNIETSKGDTTALQLLARNSFDGSWIQQLELGGWRMACANGQVWGDSMASYANRHTQNHSIEAMAEYLSHAIDVFKEMGAQWLTMQKKKLSTTEAEDLILEYLGKKIVDKEDRERVLTLDRASSVQSLLQSWGTYKEEMGSNVFALYNAFTYHATHVSESINPADAEVIRRKQITKVISPLIH